MLNKIVKQSKSPHRLVVRPLSDVISDIINVMRKTPFITGEYYHIYNRGVEKIDTFKDLHDAQRFLQSMEEFNTIEPIGSIYENNFRKNNQLSGRTTKSERLVEFLCYCVNPNHYHFVLLQVVDGGISEFIRRLSGGYTRYFNHRHKRSGVLFQGKFKSVHIDSNEYLLHLSAYVNLNNKVHKLSGPTAKLVRSSWDEYIDGSRRNNKECFCKKDIILGQFKNKSEYKKYAESSLKDMVKIKEVTKGLEDLLLE